MKYDDLFLCRMMMRMYTVSSAEPSDPLFAEKNALWQAYRPLENTMIHAFVSEGIRPTAVSVISDFNGDIKKMPELVFCCAPHTIEVPADIYGLFPAYGVPGFSAPAEPPVIRLGYTGRCYDYKTKVKLITDGLQIGSLGKIVLDMFTLKKMTKAGVSCRLTHELLHVFGVNEEEMAVYKPKAFFDLRERMDVFSERVLDVLNEAEPDFREGVCRVAEAHPEWEEAMEQLGNRLYLMGFPADPQTVLTAEIRLPEGVTSRNTVDWRLREILFM
ncbi:MAG: hypothetical protein ACI3W6_05640 [Clostridia bacterium]